MLQFFLAIFSIKLLLSCLTHNLWQWSPQTIFCPAVATMRSCELKHCSKTKRMARKHHIWMILHLFYLTIFSIKFLFSYFVRSVVLKSKECFYCLTVAATHLLSFLQSSNAKRKVRNIALWECWSFLYLSFKKLFLIPSNPQLPPFPPFFPSTISFTVPPYFTVPVCNTILPVVPSI